jgi:2,5-diketo-D-gluconate reductase A
MSPEVTLANGVSMPSLGLGTWPISDREAERIVALALETGYRLVDTAEIYGNEPGVGRGIAASGVPREEIFVTTKLGRRWHSSDRSKQAFANSAGRLDLEYIDLFLIHWPNPSQNGYVDAWRGMIDLLESDKVRAIGVSNFKPAHLETIIEATGVVPHVNQIQLNPWVTRSAEREYHAGKGIVTECWAPIGKGGALLDEHVIADIAESHSKTPAQVVVRWHLQLGLVPIPKTANRLRLAENISVFDFTLPAADMDLLSALDRGGVGVVDSDHSGF